MIDFVPQDFIFNHSINRETIVVKGFERPGLKVFYTGGKEKCLQERLAEDKYAIHTGNVNSCNIKFNSV